MNQHESYPASGHTATTVPLRHVVAGSVPLPEPTAKPTSRTGQLESTLGLWESMSGAAAGVWECDPGEFTADRSDRTEICAILTGSATVTGDDGASADVGPGSLLVLPQGWRGTWRVHDTVRKSYVFIQASTTPR
jgi:uncharacterized protein